MTSFRYDAPPIPFPGPRADPGARRSPVVRVVDPEASPAEAGDAVGGRNRASARRAVEHENARSACLGTDDVRWIMALRVHEQFEGGRAAILRPDRRRRLVELGQTLGLRPFDANLVIAVVQDAARRGESPANPNAEASLRMVPAVRVGRSERAVGRRDTAARAAPAGGSGVSAEELTTGETAPATSWGFVLALASGMVLVTLLAGAAML